MGENDLEKTLTREYKADTLMLAQSMLQNTLEEAKGTFSLIMKDGNRCSTYTSSNTCRSLNSGKTKDCPYTADRWCDECICAEAYDKVVEAQQKIQTLLAAKVGL